ncbi:PaaI family thioesterase [Novispirillum sp. DQ9]|uniref:PaaI family thioesterase n=1 Tax=Novispirillum sp. DQ9 TaxID=3398612 RepID=UPI003C7BF1AE
MFEPQDPDFKARTRASFDRQAMMKTLGVEMTVIEPGRCELVMPFNRDFTQQHGFLHAGAVTTVADSAAGYAAFSLMPADSSVLSIEFKQNLLSPAIGDKLIARAEVVRAGKTITVVDCRAFMVNKGQEKLVGMMVATMMCMHGRTDAQG